MLEAFHDKRAPSRRYVIGTVPSIDQLTDAVQAVSPHFILLLALDSAQIDDQSLRGVARQLLDRGLAYLCVWGEDCSRVHDQFDLEREEDEAEGQCVMTTWHDDEPLGEAAWFFANMAYPDDGFEADCKDWVAISVGNLDWEGELRAELVDKNEGFPP